MSGPAEVPRKVRLFYERNPFPAYNETDTPQSLLERSSLSSYASMLNEEIPYNAAVLDVGCGTGQLPTFLSLTGRFSLGADFSLASLSEANRFRKKHTLPTAHFVQMDLFRPAFKPASVDFLFCHGVLHHTADPFGGFRSILPLLKPGGYLAVGFYNTFGRLIHKLRKKIFRWFGPRAYRLDTHLRKEKMGEAKQSAWFQDQYAHPHESSHSVDEVLGWFDSLGVEYVNAMPPITLEASNQGSLLEPTPVGTWVDHLICQLGWISRLEREGGYFVLIGRKPAADDART
ncbi:MAG: class I SAM-dependent methyltransferase [Nitrospirae bacterium]|nr:class I SAM-dependent methyltransferase [Nitrospirota bacterium]